MKSLLLIGGLDPTGQAGLSRDVQQAAAEGVHPCPVATGWTVQDSVAFGAANAVPADLLVAQAAAAWREMRPRLAKVGALFSASQVDAVARIVDEHGLLLVLNPVLASSSGTAFLDREAMEALCTTLLPRAHLVVLNESEATQLSGERDAAEAAERLVELGAGAAFVTRGGAAPDAFFDGHHTALATTLQPGLHRGTGCRLASRIAAALARGTPRREAVAWAHAELQRELEDDAAQAGLDGARQGQLDELDAWMPRILAEIRHEDVPEVGMNVAYAMPGARDSRRDVCGLAGRITIAGFSRDVVGRLRFGGPHHTARIAVVVQEYDPSMRVVMNHRHDSRYLENARRNGLKVGSFNRADEPLEAPSTMEWGIRNAIQAARNVPDVIWDAGGSGKEAMMRVIAKDPADLVRKLRCLHGA